MVRRPSVGVGACDLAKAPARCRPVVEDELADQLGARRTFELELRCGRNLDYVEALRDRNGSDAA